MMNLVGSAIAVIMSEVMILSVGTFSLGNCSHSHPGGTAGRPEPSGAGMSGNCVARSEQSPTNSKHGSLGLALQPSRARMSAQQRVDLDQ